MCLPQNFKPKKIYKPENIETITDNVWNISKHPRQSFKRGLATWTEPTNNGRIILWSAFSIFESLKRNKSWKAVWMSILSFAIN